MMMPPESPRLDVIQRWMQSVIVHPAGVEAGIESEFAQKEVCVTAERVEDVICRSESQTSLERLAVYSNAYKARLLEVLIGDYPALVHAIGEEAFIGLASGYLEEHPPTSYTLTELGRFFPEYLSATRPAAETEGPDWADFLIDLARLERIYSEVFDGPGIEGHRALMSDDLLLSLEEWRTVRLVPVPCLRLATFRFPVHEYASAIRHQREPEAQIAAPTFLAITRRDYIVRRAALRELEFGVLSMLVDGKTVGEAIEWAMSASMESDLADELARWFRNWSAAGYFIGLKKGDAL